MSAPIIEGQTLAGKYRVERVLGKGGMGMVVAAMHLQLQQRVAMKFLLPGATQETIHRFLREARAAVRLKSEHVARVTDVDTLEDGTPYMVMEYLEGVDLSQRIRQAGPLPIDEAVTYLLPGLRGERRGHLPPRFQAREPVPHHRGGRLSDGHVLNLGIEGHRRGAGQRCRSGGQPAMVLALTRTTGIAGLPPMPQCRQVPVYRDLLGLLYLSKPDRNRATLPPS